MISFAQWELAESAALVCLCRMAIKRAKAISTLVLSMSWMLSKYLTGFGRNEGGMVHEIYIGL